MTDLDALQQLLEQRKELTAQRDDARSRASKAERQLSIESNRAEAIERIEGELKDAKKRLSETERELRITQNSLSTAQKVKNSLEKDLKELRSSTSKRISDISEAGVLAEQRLTEATDRANMTRIRPESCSCRNRAPFEHREGCSRRPENEGCAEKRPEGLKCRSLGYFL
jgi:chromosome segregation ATPase